MVKKQEKESALLKLPGELRNRIYGYVVGEGRAHFHAANRGKTSQTWEKHALLQVCRQLRRELSSFYYGHNTFKLLFEGFIITPQQFEAALVQIALPNELISMPITTLKQAEHLEIEYVIRTRVGGKCVSHLVAAVLVVEGNTYSCRCAFMGCRVEGCNAKVGKLALVIRMAMINWFKKRVEQERAKVGETEKKFKFVVDKSHPSPRYPPSLDSYDHRYLH